VGEKEKPEEWKKKGRWGRPGPPPRRRGHWQPAGVRRTPQAPCPCLSLCSGRKREEELGEKELKAARGRADVAAPRTPTSPPGLHRDATDPPLPLEQVSPSSSPDGCCGVGCRGGLRTTFAPPMSNLVPAALIPMPFALEPEPPGEGRSRLWSSRHRGVGAGPAGDGVVLLCFSCSKPSPSLLPLLVTAASPPCPEREVRNPRPCCGPGLRAEAGPSLVSSLFESCPLPARAAAQTHRRLRAGHRAEPVVLQVPLQLSPRALPCPAIVSYPRPDERTPSSGSPSAPTH
jgi:hypothetical protein